MLKSNRISTHSYFVTFMLNRLKLSGTGETLSLKFEPIENLGENLGFGGEKYLIRATHNYNTQFLVITG